MRKSLCTVVILVAGCSHTGNTQPISSAGGASEAAVAQMTSSTEKPSSGTMTFNLGDFPGDYWLYRDETDVYLVHLNAGDKPTYKLQGITKRDEARVLASTCGFRTQCMPVLFGNRKMKMVNVSFPPSANEDIEESRPILVNLHDRTIHVDLRFTKRGQLLKVQYDSQTKSMSAWKSDYSKAMIDGSPAALQRFVDQHPQSPDLAEAKKHLFTKQFTVKVVNSTDSAQRPVEGKGLLQSLAGSCKDMTRNVRIAPVGPTPQRDYTVDVTYTLKRYYEPHAINEPGDPLVQKATYRLNRANNFTVEDKVTFDCVLTSGRFYTATMSLLGKLAGASPADMGINTTLERTAFSLDVGDIQ